MKIVPWKQNKVAQENTVREDGRNIWEQKCLKPFWGVKNQKLCKGLLSQVLKYRSLHVLSEIWCRRNICICESKHNKNKSQICDKNCNWFANRSLSLQNSQFSGIQKLTHEWVDLREDVKQTQKPDKETECFWNERKKDRQRRGF